MRNSERSANKVAAYKEAENNYRRNKIECFQLAKIPANSQELLGLTKDEGTLVGMTILFGGRTILPSRSRAYISELMLIHCICLSQNEQKSTFVTTKNLSEQLNNASKHFISKYVEKLCSYGLVEIKEERPSGRVYELAPLFRILQEIQKEILAEKSDGQPLL